MPKKSVLFSGARFFACFKKSPTGGLAPVEARKFQEKLLRDLRQKYGGPICAHRFKANWRNKGYEFVQVDHIHSSLRRGFHVISSINHNPAEGHEAVSVIGAGIDFEEALQDGAFNLRNYLGLYGGGGYSSREVLANFRLYHNNAKITGASVPSLEFIYVAKDIATEEPTPGTREIPVSRLEPVHLRGFFVAKTRNDILAVGPNKQSCLLSLINKLPALGCCSKLERKHTTTMERKLMTVGIKLTRMDCLP